MTWVFGTLQRSGRQLVDLFTRDTPIGANRVAALCLELELGAGVLGTIQET